MQNREPARSANPTAWLHRFGCEYRLQLRLVAGHWSYWIVHLLFAAVLFALFGSRQDKAAEGMLDGSMGTLSAALTLLFSILLSGIAASRASQARFAEIAQAYPSGVEVPLAGTLAMATAGSGLLLEPLALAAWIGPWSSWVAGLLPFSAYGLVCALLGAAFTGWLAAWMPFRRWVYPLLAGAWVAFWLGPVYLRRLGLSLTVIDLYDRMENVDHDSLFGLLEPRALSAWFCAGFAALALVCLCLAVWRQGALRERRRWLPGLPLTALALVLLVWCGVRYTAVIADLEDHFARTSQPYVLPASSAGVFVSAYQAQVDLTTPGGPTVTLHMQLHNDGPDAPKTIPLALHPDLRLVSASLPAQRSQNVLTLQPAAALADGQDLAVDLVYQGELTTYGFGPQIPVVDQFLKPRSARLGLSSFWLPVAGTTDVEQLSAGGALAHPAAVQLTFKTPADVPVYSNLDATGPGAYAGQAVAWVYWVASPRLTRLDLPMLHVYLSSSDVSVAQPYLAQIEGFYRELQTFFPTAQAQPADLLAYDAWRGLPAIGSLRMGRRPVLNMDRIFYAYWDELAAQNGGSIGEALLTDLYQMTGPAAPGADDWIHSARDLTELGQWLWLYYCTGEDAAALRAALPDPQPLQAVLLEVVAQRGHAGVQQALETLRGAPLNTGQDSTATARWLKERLNVQ
jgi:hypothetical protein